MRESAIELENLFSQLESKISKDEIQAHALSIEGFYIAVSDQGDFLCLIQSDALTPSPSLRLRYLSIDYGLRLTADFKQQRISGTYTVIRLVRKNRSLLPAFTKLLEFLLTSLGNSPTASESEEFVEAFIDLFTSRKGEPRERIKGLFGELALISHSSNVRQIAAGWHDNAQSNKDFSLETAFVEVKTTEGQERKHRIASRQIEPDGLQKPVFLASICIEEDPQGLTVFELLSEIQRLVEPETQARLISTVFKTVGLNTDEANELKWSVPRGSESILLFDAASLPRPNITNLGPLSAAITSVSFDLNFDVLLSNGIKPLTLAEFSRSTSE